jgi:autotransporter-associated beta strand protein
MKPSPRLFTFLHGFPILAGIATMSFSPALAATWYWDTDAVLADAQQGSGNWFNGGVSWWNGAPPLGTATVAWDNGAGNVASLGSSAGVGPGAESNRTVTIIDPGNADTVNAGGLIFNTSGSGFGYILKGGTLNLVGPIQVAAGTSTEQNYRHQIESSISGTNVGISRYAVAGKTGLAMLQLRGSNVWQGTLALSSSEGSGLFVEVFGDSTLNTLTTVAVGVNSSLVISGAGTYSPTFTLNGSGAGDRGALRFDATAEVSGNITLAGNSRIGTLNSSIGTISGNITESGGARTLAVNAGNNNNGTIVLEGDNTYTGRTTIAGGALSVSSINSVGSGKTASSSLGAPTTVANGTIYVGSSGTGGQLIYTGGGETTDRVINLNGSTGGGTITQNGTGLLKFTSDLTATVAGNKLLTLQGSGEGELAGTIADGATVVSGETTTTTVVRLLKSGSGTWTLSKANTYTGTTTVNEGTLRLAGTGTISNGALTLGGGTLDLNGTTQTVGNLGGTSGIIRNGAAATNVTFTFNQTSNTTYGGSIEDGSGTVAVTKTGSGTSTLSGNNTYSGLTTLSTGVLIVGSNTALGSATGGTTVAGGARLHLKNGVVVTGEELTIEGPGDNNYGALQVEGNATATWNGNIKTVGTAVRLGTQLGGHLIINGDISAAQGSQTTNIIFRTAGDASTSEADFEKTGVTLGGTYNLPDLFLYQGFVKLGASDRIADTTLITLGTSATNIRQRFDLNGYNEKVAGFAVSGGAPSATHEVTNTSATASTLTLSSTDNQTFSGIVTGNLAIDKQGTNTVTFSGINTYTGDTTVTQGTFNVSGQLTGGGSMNVMAGTFNLTNSGTFVFNIGDNGDNNVISGGGVVNLNGILSFNLSLASREDGNMWDLLTNTGSTSWNGVRVTSTAGDFIQNSGEWTLADGDSTWTFNQATGILSLVQVPEPSQGLLFIAGLAGFAFRRRRDAA